MDRMVIGIAGGTASGKTTVTKKLCQLFGQDISVLYHDNYYRNFDIPYEERVKLNYDHPDTFDTAEMVGHLARLRAGETIHCPVYDYNLYNRTGETVAIHPAKVILVEGILIFENQALRDLMDIKIFVDTDADTRILRRLRRDVQKRGRTMESVIDQYLETVKPMHDQYVQPSRKYADLVMLEGGHNLVALELLIQRIRAHIDGEDFALEHLTRGQREE